MRKTQNWVFTDAAERDTYDDNGGGVFNRDTCILESDASEQYYDSNSGLWVGIGAEIAKVSTTDATLLSTFISSMPDNLSTQRFEVWIQSVQDTGVNWRSEYLTFTAHRTGGVITLELPAVAIVPATSAGSGGTVVYGFSVVPNWIFADITGNALENWSHTIRAVVAQAGP